MTVDVDDRVHEARRRLRQASDERSRQDPALRIASLSSPRPADDPLRLHPGLTVISGLSEDARASLAATVGGLFEQSPRAGLEGTVLIDGRHQSIEAPRPPAVTQLAGARAMFAPTGNAVTLPTIGWAEVDDLNDLVGSIEAAVRLTEAELRGADAAARQLRIEHTDVPEVIDLRVHEGDRAEVRETLAAMESMAPAAATIDRLRAAQTSGRGVVEALAALGIDAGGNADAIARQALRESDELDTIRRRLEARLAGVDAPTPAAPASRELQLVDARRTRLRRQLRSQRAFLAAAQDHLAFASDPDSAPEGRAEAAAIPANSGGRPLPLLVEDPLHDIPGRQGISALAVLLRVSEMCQVICVADEPELQDWTVSVGDRAQWVPATGWFAGEKTC